MDDYKQGLLDAIAEIDAELECVEIEYADAPPCLKAARRVLTNAKQLIVDKLAIETPGAEKAAIAAAVEAEREARQEAQRRLEALQERINHADKEKAQAVDAERISAANVCLEMAERMERAAGICAANGEADEVSPLRSTAWQLTVAAELIKKGRASIFDAAIRGN